MAYACICHFFVVLRHAPSLTKLGRVPSEITSALSCKLQVFNRKNTAYASIDAIFSIKSLQIWKICCNFAGKFVLDII